MENGEYVVLARKYRPQTFEQLIGQDVLVQTLTNAIEKNKVHHAFILTGIRGVGKTTTARIIAKSLNCIGEDGKGKETVKPCLKCPHCVAIANSSDQDVIEFDAASNTQVDKIRDIISGINYAPVSSRYKIYIIDEVHMLSTASFNALLKTLEEPPKNVKFIFATTEIRKVPITVLSRCIRFDLNRVSQDVLSNYLITICDKEGYKLNETSAKLIANAGEGSVRDSLSILDRIISFNNFQSEIEENIVENILGLSGKEKIYQLYLNLIKRDIANSLKDFNELYNSIVNINTFLNDLLEITHLLIMNKNSIVSDNLSSFQQNWLNENSKLVNLTQLFRIWQFIIKALEEIQYSSNIKAFIEVLLTKICFGINIPEITDLIKKLKNKTGDLKSTVKNENIEDLASKLFEGAKII